MRVYECPWCDRKSFSFWEKQGLGPTRSLRCNECKRKVGVPSDRAQIAAAPLFLLGFLGLLIGKMFGSPVRIVIRSARFPGVSDPVFSARPKAVAPSIVERIGVGR